MSNPTKRRFVPYLPLILILVFPSAFFGFADGQKVRAYLAFITHNYSEAFNVYANINDQSGLGMVSLAQNHPEQAWQYFHNVNDQSGMGLSLLARHDYDNAMKDFEVVNDNRGMGLAYLAKHDYNNAFAAFSKANDWSGLGLIYLAQKDYKNAQKVFSQAQDLTGLGLCRLKEKQYEEANQYFIQNKDIGGQGLVSLAQRDFVGALKSFQQVNDSSGMGEVYMAQGNNQMAEYYFKQKNDWNALGDLYSKEHRFADARAMFTKDYNPVKVLQSYRNDYTLKDPNGQAIAYGQQAISQGKMVPELLMEMADAYYVMKKYPNAVQLLNRAMTYTGYASEAHLRKGRIYFYMRDLVHAQAEFAGVKESECINELSYTEAQGALVIIKQYNQAKVANVVQAAESFLRGT